MLADARVPLVGSPTGGLLGGFSDDLDLPCGLRLSLQRGDVLAPDGLPIEGRGLAPDVPVVETWRDRLEGVDRPLQAALRRL